MPEEALAEVLELAGTELPGLTITSARFLGEAPPPRPAPPTPSRGTRGTGGRGRREGRGRGRCGEHRALVALDVLVGLPPLLLVETSGGDGGSLTRWVSCYFIREILRVGMSRKTLLRSAPHVVVVVDTVITRPESWSVSDLTCYL